MGESKFIAALRLAQGRKGVGITAGANTKYLKDGNDTWILPGALQAFRGQWLHERAMRIDPRDFHLGALIVLRYYRRPFVRNWATGVAGELAPHALDALPTPATHQLPHRGRQVSSGYQRAGMPPRWKRGSGALSNFGHLLRIEE